MSCRRRATTGLSSGPSMLNTVRVPISFRTGAACRMAGWKDRSEEEGEAQVRSSEAPGLVGRQGQPGAQGLEHIGAAASPVGAIAVLGHRYPQGGDDEGGDGRHVEGPEPRPAGAAQVQHHRVGRSSPAPPLAGTPWPRRRSPRGSPPDGPSRSASRPCRGGRSGPVTSRSARTSGLTRLTPSPPSGSWRGPAFRGGSGPTRGGTAPPRWDSGDGVCP